MRARRIREKNESGNGSDWHKYSARAVLLPWISIAFRAASFLNDAIWAKSVSDYIFIEILSDLRILSYPIFVAYGIISSWLSFKNKSKRSAVILKASSPIPLFAH